MVADHPGGFGVKGSDHAGGQLLGQPSGWAPRNLTTVESRLVGVLDRVVCYHGDRDAEPVRDQLRNLAA